MWVPFPTTDVASELYKAANGYLAVQSRHRTLDLPDCYIWDYQYSQQDLALLQCKPLAWMCDHLFIGTFVCVMSYKTWDGGWFWRLWRPREYQTPTFQMYILSNQLLLSIWAQSMNRSTLLFLISGTKWTSSRMTHAKQRCFFNAFILLYGFSVILCDSFVVEDSNKYSFRQTLAMACVLNVLIYNVLNY